MRDPTRTAGRLRLVGDGETASQRDHRRLSELLTEVRVVLPGVQVLFGFLLTVPFADGFIRTSLAQRGLYFVTLLSVLGALAFLMTPPAYHRLRFRQHDLCHLVFTCHRFTIAGLAMLAVALTGAVTLVADFLFDAAAALVIGTISAFLFGGLWFVLPWSRGISRNDAESRDDRP